MREDGRARRVDAGGHVVHHHVVDVVLDVLGRVAVGDDLVVGDEDHAIHAGILHGDAVLDAAEVVPQVQTARRAVAREHAIVAGIDLDVCANLVAAFEARVEAAFVGHARIQSTVRSKARWSGKMAGVKDVRRTLWYHVSRSARESMRPRSRGC